MLCTETDGPISTVLKQGSQRVDKNKKSKLSKDEICQLLTSTCG